MSAPFFISSSLSDLSPPNHVPSMPAHLMQFYFGSVRLRQTTQLCQKTLAPSVACPPLVWLALAFYSCRMIAFHHLCSFARADSVLGHNPSVPLSACHLPALCVAVNW